MDGAAPTIAISPLGDRIIKVNHAGENGAIAIYSGQIALARFTAPSLLDELVEFRSHEQRHRALFGAELQRRGQRRCRSYWLCGLGGYTLGLLTGLCGARAIAATTVAVEKVVLRHLQHQLILLRDIDTPAVAAIGAIVEEEQTHHDRSAEYLVVDGIWNHVLTPVVAASTELVIWLGMRL